MAIIERKRQDGTVGFQVKLQDQSGRWFPSTTFSTREAAEIEESRLFSLKMRKVMAMSQDAAIFSVDEYWEVWSVENRAGVSEGWRITEKQMYRDYVKPAIGALRIREVEKPHIARLLNRVRELGRGEQTVKHVYSLVRSMFGDAVEFYEILNKSPVVARFHRPMVSKAKRKFHLPDQAWRLMEFTRDHYAGPGIWLQYLAGMRSEAMIGLLYEDVQWDLNQILIRRAWKQKVKRIEDFPKGRDWEYIPVIQPLKEYLWGKWLQVRDPHQFVVQGPKGGRLSYGTYLRVVKRLCRKADVPVLETQELRHSSSEIWVRAGATPEDVRRLLNHKNLSTTMNYIHRTDERLTRIGASIGGPGLRVIEGEESSQTSSRDGKKCPYDGSGIELESVGK